MNKHMVSILSLLFFVSVLQGMFSHDKNKNKKLVQGDEKVKIQNLNDVEKMKQYQYQHRGRHDVFNDEHNKADAGGQVEKK